MRRADLVLLLLAPLLVSGCGAEDETPRTLTGDRVARMAEAQLEAEHPEMSPGSLSCQDLEFAIGATTRCTRTALLSEGRTVRVLGTVRVTSVENQGRLHVKLDDEAVAFGVTGDHLASELRKRGRSVGEVDCPDLDAVAGTTVTCELDDGTVEVTVVEVDPDEYDVEYRFGPLLPR